MFTLFILNVGFLIYVLIYLKNCQIIHVFNNYGKLIFLESILFSLSLVLSIFPVMTSLLSQSQSRSNIKKIFNSISDYEMTSTYNSSREIDETEYETNSFKIIQEIGLVSIKEFDHITFGLLTKNIYDKFKKFPKTTESLDLKRQLFYIFRDVISDLFDFSAKERNSYAMFNLLSCRYNLELVIAESEMIVDHNNRYRGWNFNWDLERYFDKAVQFNEDAICCEIIDRYRDYMMEIIKTKFPISFKYNYDLPFENIDDTSIVTTNFGLIEKFCKVVGQLKKTLVLKNISNLYSTLDLVIVESSNHVSTKQYLLQINNISKQKYLRSLVEDANVKNIEYLYYPFGLATNSEVSKLNSAIIFKGSLEAFDFIYQRNALSNVVINLLKADAMGFINSFPQNEVVYKKLILLALNKIHYTSTLINENDTDEKKETYLKLKRYLSYISSHFSQNLTNDEIKLKITEVENNFPWHDKFEQELIAKGFIQNKNIM